KTAPLAPDSRRRGSLTRRHNESRSARLKWGVLRVEHGGAPWPRSISFGIGAPMPISISIPQPTFSISAGCSRPVRRQRGEWDGRHRDSVQSSDLHAPTYDAEPAASLQHRRERFVRDRRLAERARERAGGADAGPRTAAARAATPPRSIPPAAAPPPPLHRRAAQRHGPRAASTPPA